MNLLQKKLPVWASAGEALSFVWHHKIDLLQLSFVPMVLFFLTFSVLGMGKKSDTLFVFWSIPLAIVAFPMLVISSYRYMLLGEHSPRKWIQTAWNRRHWRLLGYFLFLPILLLPLLASFAFLLFGGAALILFCAGFRLFAGFKLFSANWDFFANAFIFLKETPFWFAFLGIYMGAIIIFLLYSTTRLWLALPAISLDSPHPLTTSWHALKGNVGRVFFLFVILSFIEGIIRFVDTRLGAFMVTDADAHFFLAYFLSPLFEAVLSVLPMMISCSFQSTIYKALVGGER